MAFSSLEERIKDYELNFDYRLTKKLPLVIKIEGRNFSKITRHLPRPFCMDLGNLFIQTMLRLVKQVDGAIIGYHHSDEILIIVRNDQNRETDAWLGNRLQNIVSMTSSIVTYDFNDLSWDMDDPPDLQGSVLFSVNAFVLPNIHEAINCLIERQQTCIRQAITAATYTELSKKFNRKEVQQILEGRGIEQRVELLDDECNIEYDTHYPAVFRRGAVCYRAPVLDGQVTKHKWTADTNLPLFSESHDFLFRVLSSGHDIFRPERDLT